MNSNKACRVQSQLKFAYDFGEEGNLGWLLLQWYFREVW